MAEAGIKISRVFDATRERVWREWTEPEAFADWFGGPEYEIPLSSVSMEVKPGGAWRATMFAGPDRREIHWWGEYREVVEPERLVLTISDQPDRELAELLIVVLKDLGDDRTEMHFEQLGHKAARQWEATRKGWSGFFDRMDERLAG